MKILLARYAWFGLVGAFFFHDDMCLGGGSGSPPKPPADASPDAQTDA